MSSEKRFSEIGSEADRLWYLAGSIAIGGIAKVLLGFKAHGVENVPKSGRAIIAGNHRHWPDIFMEAIPIPARHLSMVAKKEVYDTTVISYLFRKWQTIPLDREHARHSTIRIAVERLKQERLVGIKPEGTRYKGDELLPLHPGVSRIARLGMAPTIPAAVRGIDSFPRAMLQRSAEVIFGEPIDYPKTKDEEPEHLTLLRTKIQELFDS